MQAAQGGLKTFFLFSLIATLTACGGGGGGGGGGSSTPPDTTPDSFTFAAAADAEPGEAVISEAVTINGINAATPLSVSGGEYSIAGGDFTSAASNIQAGQSVRLRVTASSELKGSAEATVTIGGVEGSFTVTTLDDITGPQANITFPPPMSAIDATEILIRGVAEDDYSDVESVSIVVTTPLSSGSEQAVETTDGFANWTSMADLAEGENTVVVSTTDSLGNVREASSTVTVHRQAFNQAFPDNEVPMTRVEAFTYDPLYKRVLVSEYASGFKGSITAVDLATGRRSTFAGGGTDEINPTSAPQGIVIDQPRKRAIFLRPSEVKAIDLDSGEVTLLSDATKPDTDQPPIFDPTGVAIDPVDPDVAYLVDGGEDSLTRIDLVSGKRFLVSDNSMSDSGPEFGSPQNLLVDVLKERAFVADPAANAVFMVNLATGVRSILKQGSDIGPRSFAPGYDSSHVFASEPVHGVVQVDLASGTYTQLHAPFHLYGDSFVHREPDSPYIFWLDEDSQGLFALDIESKTLVTISRSMVE